MIEETPIHARDIFKEFKENKISLEELHDELDRREREQADEVSKSKPRNLTADSAFPIIYSFLFFLVFLFVFFVLCFVAGEALAYLGVFL